MMNTSIQVYRSGYFASRIAAADHGISRPLYGFNWRPVLYPFWLEYVRSPFPSQALRTVLPALDMLCPKTRCGVVDNHDSENRR